MSRTLCLMVIWRSSQILHMATLVQTWLVLSLKVWTVCCCVCVWQWIGDLVCFVRLICWGSPWYNCNGWLGVKHQVTYILICWGAVWWQFIFPSSDVLSCHYLSVWCVSDAVWWQFVFPSTDVLSCHYLSVWCVSDAVWWQFVFSLSDVLSFCHLSVRCV